MSAYLELIVGSQLNRLRYTILLMLKLPLLSRGFLYAIIIAILAILC